jgi:hypothetical protein
MTANETRKVRSARSRVRSLVWYSVIAVLLVAFTIAKVDSSWTLVDYGIITAGLFCCIRVIQIEVRALRAMRSDGVTS